MKDIREYLVTESVKKINLDKLYKNVSDFKNNADIILCWVDDENHAWPMNVIVKKSDNDTIFVNPDDDRDMIEWKEFIHTTKDNQPMVVLAKNLEHAQDICDFYNDFDRTKEWGV